MGFKFQAIHWLGNLKSCIIAANRNSNPKVSNLYQPLLLRLFLQERSHAFLAPREKWKKKRPDQGIAGLGKRQGSLGYTVRIRIDLIKKGFLCEAFVLQRVASNGHILGSTESLTLRHDIHSFIH